MYGGWRDAHYKVMVMFMQYLNQNSRAFVLKGGTALMLCYGLDRFSEDIDLDALPSRKSINDYVERFCKQYKIHYRIAKDINTVKRFMLHYGGETPLKIEVSYRSSRSIVPSDYCVVNNILVYTIQGLAFLKLTAYNGRDRIRDLYDLVFIFRNYIKCLPEGVVFQTKHAFGFKGLEYFDYLIRTQHDDLIDNDKLAGDFLELYYYLGLD